MDKKVITLLKTQSYIDGIWVGEPRMAVTDKATGEEIARVPDLGAAETNAAIEAAHRAFKPWSQRLARERSRILRRWYELIIEHADELALLLTKEQGKPLAEARARSSTAPASSSCSPRRQSASTARRSRPTRRTRASSS